MQAPARLAAEILVAGGTEAGCVRLRDLGKEALVTDVDFW